MKLFGEAKGADALLVFIDTYVCLCLDIVSSYAYIVQILFCHR